MWTLSSDLFITTYFKNTSTQLLYFFNNNTSKLLPNYFELLFLINIFNQL